MAWTTSSDANGFHLLVADRSDGYAWKTAASLSEPGFDADAWVGNACVTASGKRAVVVYAPRTFTNKPELMTRGAFTAVVNLNSGAVTKLPVQSSLAYFSPGCGRGETAVVSQFTDDDSKENASRLLRVDARSGQTSSPMKLAGQITSAIPYQDGFAASNGTRLVKIDKRGKQSVLTRAEGVPFGLRADRDGGLVFLSRKGKTASTVKRWKSATTTTLATGRLTDVDLTASADGTVFITGKATTTRALPDVIKNPGIAKDATATTQAQALVESHWSDAKKPVGEDAQSVRPVTTRIASLTTGRSIRLEVLPGSRPLADKRVKDAGALSPALTPTARHARAASPTNPVEDERTCSVPRGDVRKQALQPTPRQVEWAVNQAVIDSLDEWITRSANWNNTGMSGYNPQVLFPLRALEGDPNQVPDRADEWHIPSQVLLGVTAQESNMWQATRFAVPGVTANPLIGNYYGIKYSADGDQADPWKVNWAKADCGYGITQVTDGMRKADTTLSTAQKEAVALDYAANIAAGADILAEKWNQTRKAGMTINEGHPKYIENWFFALWAYNSGFYPKSEAGSNGGKWGVGWTNNPANPLWKESRTPFLEGQDGKDDYSHAAHPQDWPYQEKVIGWAARPISALVKPGVFDAGYRYAWWNTNEYRTKAKPPTILFCSEANNCDFGKVHDGASNQTGQGPCTLPGDPNESDPLYLKCWWHDKAKWKLCDSGQCGYPVHRFNNDDYPEQPNENSSYRPRCSPDLPSGSLIVDDIPNGTTPAGQSGHTCGPAQSNGTFSFNFTAWNGTYPAKIDLHQLGAGGADHFWFTHTQSQDDNDAARLKMTGTWTLNKDVSGWMRVLVHIPDHGAHTRQATYVVRNADTTSRARVVTQRTRQNRWVSLGAFKFNGRPQVELSNMTPDGTGDEDVAFDSVAFQPLPGKPKVSMVAMGDSFSSGEGASEGDRDYYSETNYRDKTNENSRNACHRSKQAWSRQATLPGMSSSVAVLDDSWNADLDYHMVACSGARTYNMLQHEQGNSRERPQLRQGYLDQHTTLVTLSIGGNDSRFGHVITQCVLPGAPCQTKTFNHREDTQDKNLPLPPGTVPDGPYQGRPMAEAIPDLISGIVGPSIQKVIEEIHRQAPKARVVLMGYPPLLSNDAGCLNHLPLVGISPEEAKWINEVAAYLAVEMFDVADVLRRKTGEEKVDVGFANPQAFFHGKAICGDPETIHGVVTKLTESDNPILDWPILPDRGLSAQSFHPKISGARLYADTLEEVLRAMG
ncbi:MULTISPECIES: GDSL-type esterase/lipase family protein [unclassified Streptomyces]|uniref:GDSL-type esterase/lipase family protein n=1 Tax=unclassified Streptomyces TaxID=2593676 RepID=UPI0027E2B6BA|nr:MULTISPECIES: GDSL-type esterase/lipase family protein [unclassified Streptomyces]